MNKKITPFIFSGKVVPGEKKGRTIGYPTANLDQTPDENQLEPGIYAGYCQISLEGKVKHDRLKCLAYFGPRYVFGEKVNNFEVYLYHFDQSIYDHQLDVKLTHFIRPPADVSSMKELAELLKQDQAQGIKLLQV